MTNTDSQAGRIEKDNSMRPEGESDWPIFVVSLSVATERQAEITRQMQEMGLPFSFVEAADCRNGVPAEFEPQIDRPGTIARNGYPMSNGEYGCALSHLKIYDMILSRNLPGAIVLEDDAILTEAFRDFWKARDYAGYDFVQLCYFDARYWRWPKHVAKSGVELRYLAENAFMNAGYLVSNKGAAYLLEGGRPITTRADWPCDVTRLKAALTIPPIIRHPVPELAQSYIGERGSLIPAGFDFSAGYAKVWKRLVSIAAWRRFLMKRLSIRTTPGF
ncbi:glycosyltransferase family 25 protein [Paracoccus caeni]|uniref:Glycosyltransferase family 25 protein n=1 Tax=Paracoccus caeni TaxID=657651 RepID=A0A934W1L1_9RHOB|nr:glycosyltransferase family 25 protein [Paracoccus caeni]MBK4218145.1 glycosyltransferase family 25 protein [Paracoccus caeni]